MTETSYFENFISRKDAEIKELRQQNENAQTVEEVRSLTGKIESVQEEKRAAELELAKIQSAAKTEERALSPMATYNTTKVDHVSGETRKESPYASMEYRKAFMEYVTRGVAIPAELRAGGDAGTTVTSDIGAIVPETILNEFIKEVSKVRGQVFASVRKMNIKGGVKIPISQLGASFKWITETTVSGKQKAGDINQFIEFSYNIGEIRVAQTLLSQVVSLDLFESEITRIMVEAYVKAMDDAILAGTGVGQPLGITVDPRVTNVITLTETDIVNWFEWRKQLFSHIPLSKRGTGEFLFTAQTVESYLMTMKDLNERPLFKEATDLTMDNRGGSFFGRKVTLVEPDVIKDFGSATDGDVIGVFWTPTDYIINTNQQWGMKRWFDEDTNEWINKGLVIVDGKIADPSGCYLIKKEV